MQRYSNVIGFDDAPFRPETTGPVPVVGTVFADLNLTGVLVGQVTKDGSDAAETLARLVTGSKFWEHAQLVMLQGITLAGFNVVDVFELHRRLELPVLVVSRRQPDMAAMRNALITQIPDGPQKWAIIEALGTMEPAGRVYVQRVGLVIEEAITVVERLAINGHLPEPLRTAHLIAGAIAEGQSRGRA